MMLFLQMLVTTFLFLLGSTYVISVWKLSAPSPAYMVWIHVFASVLCLTGAWYLAPFMGIVAW